MPIFVMLQTICTLFYFIYLALFSSDCGMWILVIDQDCTHIVAEYSH